MKEVREEGKSKEEELNEVSEWWIQQMIANTATLRENEVFWQGDSTPPGARSIATRRDSTSRMRPIAVTRSATWSSWQRSGWSWPGWALWPWNGAREQPPRHRHP